jgi:hypothetical protein
LLVFAASGFATVLTESLPLLASASIWFAGRLDNKTWVARHLEQLENYDEKHWMNK